MGDIINPSVVAAPYEQRPRSTSGQDDPDAREWARLLQNYSDQQLNFEYNSSKEGPSQNQQSRLASPQGIISSASCSSSDLATAIGPKGPIQYQKPSVASSQEQKSSSSILATSIEDSREKVKEVESSPRYAFLRIWWLEVLSCVLFIAVLVAIFVTIFPFKNKPLPQWKYGLSINALVAVYTTILKATVVLVVGEGLSQLKWAWFHQKRQLKDLVSFDNASRGPWGALILVWRLRGRQYISCCGALVIIATLIMDPFVQQVISTYDCDIEVEGGLARIPRANGFDPYRGDIFELDDDFLFEMRKSVLAGIYSPGEKVTSDCATGNCTFPSEYHTIAYCSECTDTTSNISVVIEVNEVNEVSNITHESLNLELRDFYSIDDLGDASSQRHNLTCPKTNITQCLAMKSVNGPTALRTAIMTNNVLSQSIACPESQDQPRWGCTASSGSDNLIGAATCILMPCIRTYTAEVRNGNFTETLRSVAIARSVETNMDVEHDMMAMVNVKCLNTSDRKALIETGHEIEGKSWAPYIYDYGENRTSSPKVSQDCIYHMKGDVIEDINRFAKGFLNGTYQPEMRFIAPGKVVDADGNISSEGDPSASLEDEDYLESPQLRILYNQGKLTFDRVNKTWENISDSITTLMRKDSPASDGAVGQLWRQQTCVDVEWRYLIYPATVVFFALVFFVGMLIETRRTGSSRHDWKSSPLALLFHGFDREAAITRDETVKELHVKELHGKEMEMMAEQMSVRLSKTEDGWQFTKS